MQVSHPHAEVLYLGDFNVHHSEWLNSNSTDVGGEEAFSFCILNGLEQIIKDPTRVPDRPEHTPQILDLFFTSNPVNFNYSISAPIGSSDHSLISVSTSVTSPPPIPSTQRRLWHFRDTQRTNLRDYFTEFPWQDYCFSTGDTSECALRVEELILSGMEAYVPHTITTFSPSKPWFDGSCSDAIRQRDRAYRAWKDSPSAVTHSAFISSRNRCKAIIRKAKHSFIQKKCDDLSSSPSNNAFWCLAKNVLNNFCKKSNFPPLFRSDGTIAVSPSDKASLFGSLFSANSTLDDSDALSPPDSSLSNPMSLPIFSSRKVRRVLTSLKTNKAYGPGSIPPWILREFAPELAPILSRLFRLILKSATFPSSWKHAFVQPVPKKGDHSNPSNYRPIALTNTLSKVFESLLNTHILKHLRFHNLLSDHQYGFRKARSTGDLLSYLSHIWSSALGNYGESFVIALDISKAFDRVWHKALISKLPRYGFTPLICQLISSFLSERSISALVEGATSCSFPINSGVPQGSILSPTLFLLFIDDLLSSCSNPLHAYADDSTLHTSSSFAAQPSAEARSVSRVIMTNSINKDLNRISEWGNQNLVKFNSLKTQFLPVSLSIDPSYPEIFFNENNIQPLESFSILGVNINSRLSWKSHIVEISKAASKKLGVLFRCKSFFSSEQRYQLVKTTILPSLEYCCHIWGGSPSTYLLDRVWSKAKRLIDSPMLSSSLDPLSLRRDVASLALFYRYFHQHCSSELAGCMPPPLRRPRNTRQAASSHKYCVEIPSSRLARVNACFFPSTSRLWNALPEHVFPDSYDLSSFKRQVYQHLKGMFSSVEWAG